MILNKNRNTSRKENIYCDCEVRNNYLSNKYCKPKPYYKDIKWNLKVSFSFTLVQRKTIQETYSEVQLTFNNRNVLCCLYSSLGNLFGAWKTRIKEWEVISRAGAYNVGNVFYVFLCVEKLFQILNVSFCMFLCVEELFPNHKCFFFVFYVWKNYSKS